MNADAASNASGASADDMAWLAGPGGTKIAFDVLGEGTETGCTYHVYASENGLSAYLDLERPADAPLPSHPMLRALLESTGVRHGIDDDGLDMTLRLASQKGRSGPVEVALGDPPRHGDNGRLDFVVQPSTTERRYQTDAEGKVDYRNTNLFENVRAGKRVAGLVPPTRGTDGTGVRGELLPAMDGEPLSVRLGDNIRADEEHTSFYADADGRVCFEDNTLSVSQHFVVDGDVDYTTGAIDFVGFVEVNGQVLDEFNVHGGSGVTINGPVGSSEITSSGDIVITGGVAGKGEGLVRSEKGSVSAKYINEVRVEAAGDVTVRNEIVNSAVLSNGRVRIPAGSVLGGSVCAFRGVEAGILGSGLGVTTHVTAGIDWTVEEKINELDREIARFDENIDRIGESLKPLLADKKKLLAMSDAKKQLVKTLLEQLKTFRDRKAAVEKTRTSIRESVREGAVFQVNVERAVHPGVVVRLGVVLGQIREQVKGPLSLLRDMERETLRITQQTSFPKERLHEE